MLMHNKDIFDVIINAYLVTDTSTEYKISSLNVSLVNKLKALKVIKLDNLESFLSYLNYDYYLIFKFKNIYYFCDTALASARGITSLVKLINYNHFLRKDKILKINNKNDEL